MRGEGPREEGADEVEEGADEWMEDAMEGEWACDDDDDDDDDDGGGGLGRCPTPMPTFFNTAVSDCVCVCV